MSKARITLGGFLVSACLLAATAPAQLPEDHVGRLKQSLLASRERVQQYEWIETRVLSLDKSHTQNRRYHVSGSFTADWRFADHFGLRLGYSVLHFKLTDTVLAKDLETSQTLQGPALGVGI